jgi:3-oxoacyl-(acyl-carrier-protein) synthase
MKVYIRGLGAISPQETYEKDTFLNNITEHNTPFLQSVTPVFKQYIKPIQLRRMSRLLKMGITTAKIALADAKVDNPGAIISGTGLGLVEDTEKFLLAMLQNDEQLLTPTAFIQSTHNTLSGQIAIALKCHNYNNTYAHRGFSFESALLDGMMQVEAKEIPHALVGGFDEITEEHHSILMHSQWVKKESVPHLQLTRQKTTGSIIGEGVAYFVLAGTPSENDYAQIRDVKMIYKPETPAAVYQDFEQWLALQQLRAEDIDLLILGNNGDSNGDHFYEPFAQAFSHIPVAHYKHLVGEYHTSSAFAMWLGAKSIKHQHIPDEILANGVEPKGEINNVVIYNHFRQGNHSFMHLSR